MGGFENPPSHEEEQMVGGWKPPRHFWIIGVAVGAAARAGLVLMANPWLAKRPELATPITSDHHASECVSLLAQGVSPYEGSICHEAPVTVQVFAALSKIPHSKAVVMVIADVFTALLLGGIAAGVQRRQQVAEMTKLAVLERKDQALYSRVAAAPTMIRTASQNRAFIVVVCWLFNPMTILACGAQSTTVIANFATVAGLHLGFKGAVPSACFWLAVAAYLEMYPALLLIPVCFRAQQMGRSAVSIACYFCAFFGCLLGLSWYFEKSWKWVGNVYGVTIFVEDLTPNIGLWWYLITEMFDHFWAYFIFLLHFQTAVLIVPILVKYREHPEVLATVYIGIFSFAKTYASVGNVGLFLGMLPVWAHLLPYFRYGFVVACTFLATVVLFPIFWYTWIYNSGGNSNFFYAISLVFAVGHLILVMDFINAHGTHQYVLEHGSPRLGLKSN